MSVGTSKYGPAIGENDDTPRRRALKRQDAEFKRALIAGDSGGP